MTIVHPFRRNRDCNRAYGSQIVEIASRGDSEYRFGVIKDVSSSGACIRVYDAASLAPHVKLSARSIGKDVAATVRWRRKTEIGVQFDAPLNQWPNIDAP